MDTAGVSLEHRRLSLTRSRALLDLRALAMPLQLPLAYALDHPQEREDHEAERHNLKAETDEVIVRLVRERSLDAQHRTGHDPATCGHLEEQAHRRQVVYIGIIRREVDEERTARLVEPAIGLEVAQRVERAGEVRGQVDHKTSTRVEAEATGEGKAVELRGGGVRVLVLRSVWSVRVRWTKRNFRVVGE